MFRGWSIGLRLWGVRYHTAQVVQSKLADQQLRALSNTQSQRPLPIFVRRLMQPMPHRQSTGAPALHPKNGQRSG